MDHTPCAYSDDPPLDPQDIGLGVLADHSDLGGSLMMVKGIYRSRRCVTRIVQCRVAVPKAFVAVMVIG